MRHWKHQLTSLGMIRSVAGGIQWDLNAALLERGSHRIAGALCDHNCTALLGHYTCPFAQSLNKRVLKNSLAPAKQVLEGMDRAVRGLRIGIDRFLSELFDGYCAAFHIPTEVASVFRDTLVDSPIEINITGGNPELHPDMIPILQALKDRDDITTCLTTTGRRLMLDRAFRKSFLRNPPDAIALSVDDFQSVHQVRELCGLKTEALRRIWEGIPSDWGQRQKAIEAIAAASILSDDYGERVNFNLVVHRGNLPFVEQLIDVLGAMFPKSEVFPYPAQTAFLAKTGSVRDHAPMGSFVERMIHAHIQKAPFLTKRLQYWLALKSVYLVHGSDPRAVVETIGGNNLWICYAEKAVNRYLQIGQGSGFQNDKFGGGYLGCNWNRKTFVKQATQIWQGEAQDIAAYVLHRNAQTSPDRKDLCSGCAFPRLMFDVINTEMGMNPALLPAYFKLRRHYAGY